MWSVPRALLTTRLFHSDTEDAIMEAHQLVRRPLSRHCTAASTSTRSFVRTAMRLRFSVGHWPHVVLLGLILGAGWISITLSRESFRRKIHEVYIAMPVAPGQVIIIDARPMNFSPGRTPASVDPHAW